RKRSGATQSVSDSRDTPPHVADECRVRCDDRRGVNARAMAPALQQHWNTTSTFRALPEAVVALFLAGVSEAALDRLRGQSATRQTLVCPHQDLLQLREELLPSRLGAPVGLLLIRPEAQLLHAQVSPRARWGERKGHYTL